MKKKMLLFAALVAASSTAFVACSSSDDDVLSQATVAPAAEETVGEEGTPLVFKISDETRANYLKSTTLENFTIYSVRINPDNDTKVDRWLCSYSDEGTSTGTVFSNTVDTSEGDHDPYTGTFTNAQGIKWVDGTWDFYAISDASFYQESDGGEGEQDAEHLAELAPGERNFTYEVPTDYNTQKDLLVGAAMGQTKSTNSGVVEIPFQHALAQIGQITFTFEGDNAQYDNTSYYFIIKSMTLGNVKTTGKYTFPATWTANVEKKNLNNEGTWTPLDETGDYHFEFPQFELDVNGNYMIFAESESEDASENQPTAFATFNGTTGGRGVNHVPNYFHCPDANGSFSYVLPLAEKTGSEGDGTNPYINTKPTVTYTEDHGLFVIPQDFTPTVWEEDGSGNVIGVNSGVYAKIEGVVLQFNDASDPESIDEAPLGWTAYENVMTLPNNYYITKQLNDNIVSYLVPLTVASGKSKKVLKAGHRYNLTFNLAEAVSTKNGQHIFKSEEVDPSRLWK